MAFSLHWSTTYTARVVVSSH